MAAIQKMKLDVHDEIFFDKRAVSGKSTASYIANVGVERRLGSRAAAEAIAARGGGALQTKPLGDNRCDLQGCARAFHFSPSITLPRATTPPTTART